MFRSAIMLNISGFVLFLVFPFVLARASPHVFLAAGNGEQGYGGDDGPAEDALLNLPNGLAVDPVTSVLFIADTKNNRVRAVAPGDGDAMFGNITTFAGTGVAGYSGDGGLAINAMLDGPYDVAVSDGVLYFTDENNAAIRAVSIATGVIWTLTSSAISNNSLMVLPAALAIDCAGSVYFSDLSTFRVFRVNWDGSLTTVAGNGEHVAGDEDVPATSTAIAGVTGLAFDGHNNLIIAELWHCRVRAVNQRTGIITTIAGVVDQCKFTVGGPALNTTMHLNAVAYDAASDRIFMSDPFNERILALSNGTVVSIAGTGATGYFGDGGLAAKAKFNRPNYVRFAGGSLYVNDYWNNRIRVITGAASN